MSLVLRKYPDWPETLCSTDLCGGAMTLLLSADGCQVQVPAALLVAASPLVKSMMGDLLPPAYSPHVISIPSVTGDVLLVVGELLIKGAAVEQVNNGEVQEVFKMMKIQAFLSHCVGEVKHEDLTKDCSGSENFVKTEKHDEIKESEYYEDFGKISTIKVENKMIESKLAEGKNPYAEVQFPSNESKPKDNKVVIDCDIKVHKKRSFDCEKCAYRGVSRECLKKHMLVHSREKPLACDQCAYRAVRSRDLKKHVLTHSFEKPFACDQCAYRAVRRTQLKLHVATHTGKKPFECDQCDYRAVRRGHLKEHMATHTGEKPFACEQCAYRAVRRAELKQHLMIHTAEKPFACDQCAYRGVRRESLKDHMATHTGEKPFECDQCAYRAVRKGELKKHKARKHEKNKIPSGSSLLLWKEM